MDYYQQKFSQKEICRMMGFNDRTVTNWTARKGFRLIGNGPEGELVLGRGNRSALSVRNAIELMIVIDLARDGVDPLFAHEAAIVYTYTGCDSRDPTGLFKGAGTFLAICDGYDRTEGWSRRPQPYAIIKADDDLTYEQAAKELCLTSDMRLSLRIYNLENFIPVYRTLMGFDPFIDGEGK